MTDQHSYVLNPDGYRRATALDQALRTAAERWLDEVGKALGFEIMDKGGREICSTRWHADGRTEVEVYRVNENGNRYEIGEGESRRAATEWIACPVDPPQGLKNFAARMDE